MKKIINLNNHIVDDMLSGYVKAHSDRVQLEPTNKRIIRMVLAYLNRSKYLNIRPIRNKRGNFNIRNNNFNCNCEESTPLFNIDIINTNNSNGILAIKSIVNHNFK